jgi:acylphosphatase
VSDTPAAPERVTIFVRGHVQGVGFRWWARSRALELGLAGHARNLDDGRVEIVAQGPPGALDTLVQLVQEKPSTSGRPGRVTAAVCQPGPARPTVRGFLEL